MSARSDTDSMGLIDNLSGNRLVDRILALEAINAELLAVAKRLAFLESKDGGRTFPSPADCAAARAAIAKAEGK